MTFDDYKVVLYRQDDGSWVAEVPALGGCYALMDTREAALAELEQVFTLIAQEHRDRGVDLPKDTTEIVHAQRAEEVKSRGDRLPGDALEIGDRRDAAEIEGVLAKALVRVHRLGIPQQTHEVFDLIEAAGLLDAALADRLRKMVGLRNVAIRDYQKLNLDVVRRIIVDHLDDFLAFARSCCAPDRLSGGSEPVMSRPR